MRILALDLATATGWAAGPSDGEVQYGTIRMTSTGQNVGAFACQFDAELRHLIELAGPEIIVFESPIIYAGKTSVDVARKLMGLAWHTEYLAAHFELPCREANLMTVKKNFTGRGNAKKEDMIDAARRYGWRPRNDNEADALAVWSYSVQILAPEAHGRRFKIGLLGA